MCPYLDNSKAEVKIALELSILKELGIYDEYYINSLTSEIIEPTRSIVRKEVQYMSKLSLKELYLELSKCSSYSR